MINRSDGLAAGGSVGGWRLAAGKSGVGSKKEKNNTMRNNRCETIGARCMGDEHLGPGERRIVPPEKARENVPTSITAASKKGKGRDASR